MPNLKLIKRNGKWWSSTLSLYQKIIYYPAMMKSFIFAGLFNKRYIKYLGIKMEYDNKAIPLSLQLYPHEISKKILSNIDEKIYKVLDIGGNIGQFSITLSHFLDSKAKIDVIEPNPNIYGLLKNNTCDIQNINTYNIGIGDSGEHVLHFEPGKSATGSLYKKNAGNSEKLRKAKVNFTSNVHKLTSVKKYDLVKIDVEGYEFDLIRSAGKINAKYLFIEVSGLGRFKNYKHSELFMIIKENFGNFDILYITQATKDSNNFDMLLKFK